MEKKIISFVLGILLLGVISASGLQITPDSVSFNTYAGETKNVTFNVSSDGDYLVYFNSSNQYIDIIPNNMTITTSTTQINLSFKIANDAPLGVLSTTTEPTIYVPDNYVVSHAGRGGSSRTVYKNNTIYVNNTVEVPKIINNTIYEFIDKECPIQEKRVNDIKTSSIIWVIVIVLLLLIVCYLVKMKWERVQE